MQQQLSLDTETTKPVKYKGERCKNCVSMYRHEYRSDWKYCSKRSSNLTSIGHQKIKANDKACDKFENKKVIMCDTCGHECIGETFDVYNENFVKQKGLVMCSNCKKESINE